jgi:predicted anti-sigma-YlaC factor YlaD
VSFLATDCARARESVSVQLDGELPELELDRLETHLRICPECSSWAGQVRDITQQLRGVALEVPAESFVLPQRSRRWAVSSAVALASAAAVVATMFVTPGQHPSVGSPYRMSPSTRLATTRLGVSRLARLEDGVYAPSSATPSAFQPV